MPGKRQFISCNYFLHRGLQLTQHGPEQPSLARRLECVPRKLSGLALSVDSPGFSSRSFSSLPPLRPINKQRHNQGAEPAAYGPYAPDDPINARRGHGNFTPHERDDPGTDKTDSARAQNQQDSPPP